MKNHPGTLGKIPNCRDSIALIAENTRRRKTGCSRDAGHNEGLRSFSMNERRSRSGPAYDYARLPSPGFRNLIARQTLRQIRVCTTMLGSLFV